MRRYHLQNFDALDFSNRIGLGLTIAFALFLLVLLLKLLMPWLLVLGAFYGVWYLWQRHRRFQEKLYQCFYELLQSNQGRISVIDFAMAAQVTGPRARAFLDARAKDFFAEFEPSTQGDIFYTFRTPQVASQFSSKFLSKTRDPRTRFPL